MQVAVTGATGFIGSALCDTLKARGHQPRAIVRSTPRAEQIGWNIDAGTIEREKLRGFDAVVHLAGENIAARRWTKKQKARILHSRVAGTSLLSRTLAEMPDGPRTFLSASAIGFYGDRGDEVCTEESKAGNIFLSEVCRAWENAADPARKAGLRVVHPRIGVVLSKRGGALSKMLLPFRLGAGGRVGSGRQYWSWITLEDLVNALVFMLERDELTGPVNATAPHPSTNLEFTKALGKVLHRPTIFPAPAFALRAALGGMADELLLASTRAVPHRLEAAGFKFAHPELEGAIESVLGDNGMSHGRSSAG